MGHELEVISGHGKAWGQEKGYGYDIISKIYFES